MISPKGSSQWSPSSRCVHSLRRARYHHHRLLTSGSTSVGIAQQYEGLEAGRARHRKRHRAGTTIQTVRQPATSRFRNQRRLRVAQSLSFGTASAINAAEVFINAKYVDINEPINVGQPNNWSVSLPASLNSTIQADQTTSQTPVNFGSTAGTNSATVSGARSACWPSGMA